MNIEWENEDRTRKNEDWTQEIMIEHKDLTIDLKPFDMVYQYPNEILFAVLNVVYTPNLQMIWNFFISFLFCIFPSFGYFDKVTFLAILCIVFCFRHRISFIMIFQFIDNIMIWSLKRISLNLHSHFTKMEVYLLPSSYPRSPNLCMETVVDCVSKPRIFIQCSCPIAPLRGYE